MFSIIVLINENYPRSERLIAMTQLIVTTTVKERRKDSKTEKSMTRAITHNGCKEDQLNRSIYLGLKKKLAIYEEPRNNIPSRIRSNLITATFFGDGAKF